MLLYFVGLSAFLVWHVFQDPALDFRLVMLGAVLPDVGLLFPGGYGWVLHTLLASALLLTAVMLGTRHRRSLRRRLLAIPIGTFVHLVLDFTWTDKALFWWPAFGRSVDAVGWPSAQRPLAVVVLLELLGAAALAWLYRRFAFGVPARRKVFLRTGRVGRDLRDVV